MPSLARTLLLVVGGAVVAGGALVGVASASAGDTVPRGVHLDGTDLGGMTPAQTREAVERALADRAGAPVVLVADGERHPLAPGASGLSVDVDAVVDDAMTGGPLDRVQGLLGTRREVDVVGVVDEAALRTAVEGVAEDVDRGPREGAVRFEGTTPVPVRPQTGRELDVDAATTAVRGAWLRTTEPVEAPVEVEQVRTTEQDVQEAITSYAAPAVAAPVEVTVGQRTLVVRPSDIAAALTMQTDGAGTITPRFDAAKLDEALGERVDEVEQAPVDATIRVRGGTPQVVPAKTGLTLDPEVLRKALLPVLPTAAPRRATVALAKTEPELTTAEAQALGVKEVIGTFTTRFPCCRPRVTNIRRIAALVDDTLVLPDETFSLNGQVGRRTAAKGFVPAPQILDGEFVDDVGGGVSQFATTLFNAYFFAGLEDVEHKAHSYYITRYPEGREATVFFPEVDLKFRNDSGKGVLVTTSSTGTSVTVTLWGTKRYEVEALKGPRSNVLPFQKQYVERDDCTAAAGHVGFDVTVTRVFKQSGREVKRERFFTRYKPEPNFICGPPPAGEPAAAG